MADQPGGELLLVLDVLAVQGAGLQPGLLRVGLYKDHKTIGTLVIQYKLKSDRLLLINTYSCGYPK